jgi:hypothetical protein
MESLDKTLTLQLLQPLPDRVYPTCTPLTAPVMLSAAEGTAAAADADVSFRGSPTIQAAATQASEYNSKIACMRLLCSTDASPTALQPCCPCADLCYRVYGMCAIEALISRKDAILPSRCDFQKYVADFVWYF